jgi:hypothetical protein
MDGDDELVFVARDAGVRAARDELPGEHDDAREIELRDPATGSRAWVYLLHFSGEPPPRSTARYASFDATENRARALSYEITYAPDRSYFTDVRVGEARGAREQALLARTRLLVNPTFSLLLTSWSPVFDEESYPLSIDGIRNGTARRVRFGAFGSRSISEPPFRRLREARSTPTSMRARSGHRRSSRSRRWRSGRSRASAFASSRTSVRMRAASSTGTGRT